MKVYYDEIKGVLVVDSEQGDSKINEVSPTFITTTYNDLPEGEKVTIKCTQTNETILPQTIITEILDVTDTAYTSKAAFLAAIDGWLSASNSSSTGTVGSYYELPDDAIQITVTSTASTVQALLEVANATLTVTKLSGIKYIELNPEGDIRYAMKSTPTTTTGMKLASDLTRILVNVDTTEVELIASASTVCNISIGY